LVSIIPSSQVIEESQRYANVSLGVLHRCSEDMNTGRANLIH